MRYAYGIILGAILPFMIFLGAAIIKIQSLGWDIYVLWFFLSIGFAVFPPILVRFAQKDAVREFLIFEAGGFGLFSPLWIFIFTDLSGDSWTVLLLDGIIGGLIGPGPANTIVPMDVSNVMLIPLLALCILIGVIFLRPSFIAKHGSVGEMTELRELKESTETVTVTIVDPSEPIGVEAEDPIEYEMPEVAPPVASADTMADLRGLLTELGTPEPTINLIFNAGIATTTDLVATSPDQLSTLTGIDKRTAEDLQMAVQKKVWFGGI
ncbi:MAG: helix-hairpin-helix domain-containing protein [Candidatus Thorarchaeota archaeon]|nr:helix-hairpin-helix domain-containing protein [Candidatus Thorarchaeota archaeon]